MTDKCNICDKEYQHRGWLSRHKRLKDHYDENERHQNRITAYWGKKLIRMAEGKMTLFGNVW